MLLALLFPFKTGSPGAYIVPSEREIKTAYSDMIKGPPLVQYTSIDALVANKEAALDELSKRQRAVALHVLKMLTTGRISYPTTPEGSTAALERAEGNEAPSMPSSVAAGVTLH
ncbi:hypothetical protein [Ralstonia pseudosolanacearum]|uniref:hypothetical protein n=1 Tax=Ralstonia pseudosolanacearum TaxID=1310165 RepID=UPI001FF8F34D|nr:hypothetical protein [Ralstonia pseudosolanacearum]